MISRPAARDLSFAGVVAGIALVIGAAVVVTPMAAVLALVIGGVATLAWRSTLAVERAGSVLLLGGAMILGYGFANLGIRGAVPLPLAELLLVPLLFFALRDRRARLPGVTLPVLGFLLLVGLRLLIDYPVERTDAIRDATLAVEMLAIYVGARAITRDGIAEWTLRLWPILMLVVAYGALFPIRNTLEAIGPSVGLQRSVPLLGSMAGVPFAVAAAALFFAVYATGWRRLVLFGGAMGVAVIHQQRSLYLLIPAAVAVLGWAIRRPVRLLGLMVAALTLGAVALTWLLPGQVEGRFGPTTPAFVVEHARTLFGEGGPGAGSIDDRAEWAGKTLEAWSESPSTIAFGVGLGPDLTFGFRKHGDIAVRKPHNDFLEVLARTGLVGLTLFLWIIGALLVRVVRAARAGGERGRFCAWILGTSVIYLGVAAVQPVLAFPYGTIPLFMLLGMGAAAAREPAPEQRPWAG